MRNITTEEYQKRKLILYAQYGNMLSLSYEISAPFGWLGVIEDMFIYLDVSLKNETKDKIKFLDLKSKYATARFHWSKTDELDDIDNERTTSIIKYYEELASKKCEICGAPARLVIHGGYYMKRCPEHLYDY